jgi:hypothetical protein
MGPTALAPGCRGFGPGFGPPSLVKNPLTPPIAGNPAAAGPARHCRPGVASASRQWLVVLRAVIALEEAAGLCWQRNPPTHPASQEHD